MLVTIRKTSLSKSIFAHYFFVPNSLFIHSNYHFHILFSFLIYLSFVGLSACPGENQDRLSCFDCRSGNSWEECGSREGEQRCQNGENRCGLLSLESSVHQIYMKGCFKDSDCINYQHPNWCSKNAAADPHCFSKIICCEHDFCN